MGQLVAAAHAGHDVAVLLVLPLKAAFHLALGVKGLDDAQTADGLLDVAQHHAPLGLSLERNALQAFAHTAHHEPCHRQQHKHKQSQLPTQGNHHRQAGYDHDRILEHHVERGHDGVLHLGHITAHAGHHVALALVGEETDGQGHDLVVNLVADVAHHARANGNHTEGAQVGAPGLKSCHHNQRGSDTSQRRRLPVALDDALHIVVEVVGQHGVDLAAAHLHVTVGLGVEAEEHLQYGDDQRKREQRQKCRQQVEHDVQRQIFLIRRYKAPEQMPKSFHACKGSIKFLVLSL